MTLTHDELEFLSAWAREEWEPACYQLPSHRLQLGHSVSDAQLIVFIKAWTEGEGKKDQDILGRGPGPGRLGFHAGAENVFDPFCLPLPSRL